MTNTNEIQTTEQPQTTEPQKFYTTGTGRSYLIMQNAEEINPSIAQTPQAVEKPLYVDNKEVEDFKAIVVTDKNGVAKIVSTPKKSYQLIQNEQAFRPIIRGLTQAGIHDFKFILKSTHKRAEMQIYATGTGYDTISLGFNVVNSFDGSKALSYGFRIFGEEKSVELVGYRQVCSNGMKIRVPLENAEFVREEVKSRVTELVSKHSKILHTISAKDRIENMQYVTEAISLLREPIELYIKKAQHWTIENEYMLNQLIKNHIGKRFQAKVREQYKMESQDLWGLYNAITFIASHDTDLKPSARDTLIEKACVMLEQELKH